jgi:(1->4)-alpha-D-glucan 1-alpha-D-glucosylmutase
VSSQSETQTKDPLSDQLAEAIRQRIQERQRLPQSTYRLQLHAGFTFRQAQAVIPYLAKLGISDCYCSPVLRARPGSTHGYDICAHGQLNPELGDESDYQAFVDELAAHDLGQILDFVPNHMAADPEKNPWWRSVLEDGPASPFATFFDIDWHPVKPELDNKVLLPVLSDHYGIVLEQGELQLEFDNGAFVLRYHDHSWPVDPGQYPKFLRAGLGSLQTGDSTVGEPARMATPRVTDGGSGVLSLVAQDGDTDLMEFQSILTALEHLPGLRETDPDRKAERQREKKVARDRLGKLEARSPRIRKYIKDTLRAINGQPGRPDSFNRLHELLEALPYRLAYWRTASDEVDYRRFFDINDLVGMRMEEPGFFSAAHELVFRLVRERKVTGLRLDHLDGLFDPAGYLNELQEAILWEWTADLIPSNIPVREWRRQIRRLLYRERAGDNGQASRASTDSSSVIANRSPLTAPLFVIVEKILSGNETLPQTWPIHGTTGYDFLNDLNRLYVESRNMKALTRAYEHFTGQTQPLADVVYECKELITWTVLASELNILAHAVNRISEGNRRARDFTLNNLREALREVVACFPVYRTYVSAAGATEADRTMIDLALARARQRNPLMEPLVFDFLRQALLPVPPKTEDRGSKMENGISSGSGAHLTRSSILNPQSISSTTSPNLEKESRERLQFAMRTQQFTGPVQAKGLEDTAFYRYNRLLSLNEVGGDPQRFGGSTDQFHEVNRLRRERWPYAMLATATHDTKRGEDARARLNVLSEIPDDWRRMIFQWGRLNAGHRSEVHGEKAPDRNVEYLFYQALLGAWPAESAGTTHRVASIEFVQRMQDYMLKAVKEAKVHSSWINPNADYDRALSDFVNQTLAGRRAARFLASFLPFQHHVAKLGMINSLSQVLLKLISPGVPDIYQGTELWDFSLVDPDNRRPVDFAHRLLLLNNMEPVLPPLIGGEQLLQPNAETEVDGAALAFASARQEAWAGAKAQAGVGEPIAAIHTPQTLNQNTTRLHRVAEMLEHWEDGRIKLMLLSSALRLRRRLREVFQKGEYLALSATGEKADHVVGILRRHEGQLILAVAPRLVASFSQLPAPRLGERISGGSVRLPIGSEFWGETGLNIPSSLRADSFENVLTGERVLLRPVSGKASLRVADALSICPVGLLQSRDA